MGHGLVELVQNRLLCMQQLTFGFHKMREMFRITENLLASQEGFGYTKLVSLFACLSVCLSVYWLVGWLVRWLVGWLVGWFAGWLVDWLVC